MKLEEYKCSDCGGVAYLPCNRNVDWPREVKEEKAPQCPYIFEVEKCGGDIMEATGKTLTIPDPDDGGG